MSFGEKHKILGNRDDREKKISLFRTDETYFILIL